jgi:hypothetical protein
MHAMDGHANPGIQTAMTDTAMGQVTASYMFAISVLCVSVWGGGGGTLT